MRGFEGVPRFASLRDVSGGAGVGGEETCANLPASANLSETKSATMPAATCMAPMVPPLVVAVSATAVALPMVVAVSATAVDHELRQVPRP